LQVAKGNCKAKQQKRSDTLIRTGKIEGRHSTDTAEGEGYGQSEVGGGNRK